jgi:hypothetical protein
MTSIVSSLEDVIISGSYAIMQSKRGCILIYVVRDLLDLRILF